MFLRHGFGTIKAWRINESRTVPKWTFLEIVSARIRSPRPIQITSDVSTDRLEIHCSGCNRTQRFIVKRLNNDGRPPLELLLGNAIPILNDEQVRESRRICSTMLDARAASAWIRRMSISARGAIAGKGAGVATWLPEPDPSEQTPEEPL